MKFAHLHNHTEYSLLDGMPKAKKLVEKAVSQGSEALAITDHGTMFGALDFYENASKAGIKPIIGMESYMTQWGRGLSKDPKQDRQSYHLLLLAKNNTGYKNLMQLATVAQFEGFYHKPRISHELLLDRREGLIVTSGCMAAELPRLIQANKHDEAEERLQWYLDTFGDDFYIELQRHDNVPELEGINEVLIDFARKHGVAMIATNDVHYVEAGDAIPHDHLLCVQTNAKVADVDRMRMTDHSYYLKSNEEMEKLFGHVQEALSNTALVADKCNVSLTDKGFHLPAFDKPKEYKTDDEYLREICRVGFEEKYGIKLDSEEEQEVVIDTPLTPDSFKGKTLQASKIRERLNYELSVIARMNFSAYFLIVWDIIEFCRKNGIWWNIRGSGAGSMVSYVLGLTYLEPLSHQLFFERFLNPDRISMPDLDMDFADDQRYMVIDYTVDKYGAEQVAQIITFGTMAAKAAVKDVGRVMGIDLKTVDKIIATFPTNVNKQKPIKEWKETIPELIELCKDPVINSLVTMAGKLEGTIRNAGTHAAGVVIADKPLVEYVPLHRLTGNSLSEKINAVTQYEMNHLESNGLLKMDYLGLKTLTTMRKACELIAARHGVTYTLSTIPINDPVSYWVLSNGKTLGVFQSESKGMTAVMTEMRPSKFEHVSAAISLFRPGPMDYIPLYIRRLHGKEQPQYRDESMIPALENTFGIMVYQEQVMRIGVEVAGFTMAEADYLRKAIGKKDKDALLKQREKFVKGVVKMGHPEELGTAIFDDIEAFARYAFNLAHAADYAQLAVQTAFLKKKYPLEYMTAFLNSEYADLTKVGEIISECKLEGIEVLPPNINRSLGEYVIENGGIRYGLNSIKGLGVDKIRLIEEARKTGEFVSIQDFLARVDASLINKKVLEGLFGAGCFDDLGDRQSLLDSIDEFLGEKKAKKKKANGQAFILDILEEEQKFEYYGTQKELTDKLVEIEFELLGVYFSESSSSKKLKSFKDNVTHTSGEINAKLNGRKVVVAGIVKSFREITTKTQKQMAFVNLQDWDGKLEITVFPQQWEANKGVIVQEAVLTVNGKVEVSDRGTKLIADAISVTPLNVDHLKPVRVPEIKDRVYVIFNRDGEGDDVSDARRMTKIFSAFGEEGASVSMLVRGTNVVIDYKEKAELTKEFAEKVALLNLDA